MTAHLRYLRYVLLHKWYVFRAGVALNGWTPRWVWRLLIHDLSKFRPSEWQAYADSFYRDAPTDVMVEFGLTKISESDARWGAFQERLATIKASRRAAFNYAWLLHQHRNDHHWQHWLLQEDNGPRLVLLMPAVCADEMLADWVGAGTKILTRPTLRHCIAETIAWYCKSRGLIQLRDATRARVERNLLALAEECGLGAMARYHLEAQATRASITIPGRS